MDGGRSGYYRTTNRTQPKISDETIALMINKMTALEQRVIELEKNMPKIPFKFVSKSEEQERKRQASVDIMHRMKVVSMR